jgi:hypothetical protein
VFAALPLAIEVDADEALVLLGLQALHLSALQLFVDLKEAIGEEEEGLVLVIANALLLAEVAPEILGFLSELVDGELKVLVAGDDIELQAADHMNVVFDPVLREGDGLVECDNHPMLWACLGGELSICVGHLVDAAA